MNEVKFVKTYEDAIIPKKSTQGSCGWDLYARLENEVSISKGNLLNISCGIAVELPSEKYAALVFSRSGLGFKYGICLANSVGVIDSDYRGEIRVALCRVSDGEPYIIRNKDRIAQIIIINIENFAFKEVKDISETKRGIGGFGSTGR
ncbi:MAG: dUTP diphosphatase [Oscillospiraceae bacterium]|nr:dUTP diphosphatase [Oscillospiraceae bacterium]